MSIFDKNCAALTGHLPGRCNSISRNAPCAQTTTIPSGPASIMVPARESSATASSARQHLIRSSSSMKYAPGTGLKARTRRASSAAGRCQSILASVVLILCAYVAAASFCSAALILESIMSARYSTRSVPPAAANRSCSSPAFSAAPISRVSLTKTGPQSSPAVIDIRHTPVSSSAARIAA